jgi:hypothetical protein
VFTKAGDDSPLAAWLHPLYSAESKGEIQQAALKRFFDLADKSAVLDKEAALAQSLGISLPTSPAPAWDVPRFQQAVAEANSLLQDLPQNCTWPQVWSEDYAQPLERLLDLERDIHHAVVPGADAAFLQKERDALAAELDLARQSGKRETDAEERLAAADARIRELELQLFGNRGPRDKDVDLMPELATGPAFASGVRRAKRYSFADKIEVRIDDETKLGVLVDLSVNGAQVLFPKELTVNRAITIALLSDEHPISCRGRVVWSFLEPHAKGKSLRYRAGIEFTDADEAVVEAFIIRYSVG